MADQADVALVSDDRAALPPSPYGDGPPYPRPTDRVDVVVYSLLTGDIKQRVRCALQDEHRQHLAFPNSAYVEVTGTDVGPETHVVDLAAKAIKLRTTPTPGQLAVIAQETFAAARTAREAKIDALIKNVKT
jgi:hypothetical protein